MRELRAVAAPWGVVGFSPHTMSLMAEKFGFAHRWDPEPIHRPFFNSERTTDQINVVENT